MPPPVAAGGALQAPAPDPEVRSPDLRVTARPSSSPAPPTSRCRPSRSRGRLAPSRPSRPGPRALQAPAASAGSRWCRETCWCGSSCPLCRCCPVCRFCLRLAPCLPLPGVVVALDPVAEGLGLPRLVSVAAAPGGQGEYGKVEVESKFEIWCSKHSNFLAAKFELTGGVESHTEF